MVSVLGNLLDHEPHAVVDGFLFGRHQRRTPHHKTLQRSLTAAALIPLVGKNLTKPVDAQLVPAGDLT